MTEILRNLSPEKLYLIALSGGADSVALSLMMKRQGLNIRALHCNFHLRGEESDRDEHFVHNFCQEHHIPLEVKHFDTLHSAQLHKNSIEMEARNLRYQWFAQRCKALDAEAICVAHHKDDQAETLLLNLIRGTGLKGLSAMHPDREINGLRIIRPLLDITRKDIIQYLSAIGQTFVTDSTNLERDALRNRIRLDLMPMLQQLNPNITECLARTAHNVRMELDPTSEEGHYHIWLAPLGFSRSQILDIYAHRPTTQPLTAQNSTNNATPLRSGLMWHSSTHTLLLNRGEWILQKRGDSNKSQAELLIENLPTGSFPTAKDFLQKEQAFIDAHSIRGKLILRPTRQGDRFQPYGMKHGTKLVSDYLTDRKVSLLEKSQQLVAIDSATDSIVWLVGREIDHNYRIDHSSTNILRLRIISKSC